MNGELLQLVFSLIFYPVPVAFSLQYVSFVTLDMQDLKIGSC